MNGRVIDVKRCYVYLKILQAAVSFRRSCMLPHKVMRWCSFKRLMLSVLAFFLWVAVCGFCSEKGYSESDCKMERLKLWDCCALQGLNVHAVERRGDWSS